MTILLEAVAFLELLSLWLVICLRYGTLPDQLHPFLNGGTGDKGEMWALLAIATFLYLLLTGISHIPDPPINLPGSPGPATIVAVRRLAVALLLWMKLVLMAMFLTVAVSATQAFHPAMLRLTMRFLPACLLIFILAFLIRIFRAAKNHS